MLSPHIQPFYPIYARAPNKLLRYEDRPFELDRNCNGIVLRGIERIAIFRDSKDKEQEMVAQVIWENI